MTTAKKIATKVQRFRTDVMFSVADLGFPVEQYDNVRVTLSRLVVRGYIVKAGKGRYIKPRKTIFGALGPSREEIVKDLLFKNGKPIGYFTGYAIWNKMGLTTQVPNIIEIGSNIRRNKTRRGDFDIRFSMQLNNITRANIHLLQILDAVKALKSIPDAGIGGTVKRLADIIKGLSVKEAQMLASLAVKYSPQTRAIVGAMLENIGYKELSLKLYKTLNHMTKYKLGITEQILPNYKKWYIQ